LNFPRSFTNDEAIPNIERSWLEDPDETNGIFNWMLEGLYRLKEKHIFSTSKTTEETKAEFMRVSDPFRAWLNDCCVFLSVGKVTRQEAYDNYKEYADELGATPENARNFYNKIRKTPRIKEYRSKINGQTERGFKGIHIKSENERENNQQTLEEVSEVSRVSSSGYTAICESSNKEGDIKPDTSDTPDTNDDFIEKYFPKNGQFPICFSCHEPIIQLSQLTNIEGKPIHKRCKEELKKGRKVKELVSVEFCTDLELESPQHSGYGTVVGVTLTNPSFES